MKPRFKDKWHLELCHEKGHSDLLRQRMMMREAFRAVRQLLKTHNAVRT